MEKFHCLLCLSSLDKDIRANKSSIKAQIVRLYDLLVPGHRTSTPHQTIIEQIEDSDGFKLCKDCFLSAKEIEKIKLQLTQLEQKIATKVEELRATVSKSFSKNEKIEESLQRIRKSLLSSAGEESDHILTNFKVKPEPDDDDNSYLFPNYEDQLPPTSPTSTNQSDDQDDPLFRLNDADELSDSDDDGSTSSDESDLYITPDNENKDKKNKRTTRTTKSDDSKNESSSPPKRKRVRKYVPRRKKYDESCYTFSCAVCSSKFRKERHLRLHLRQEHKGFCQFQCQICQNKHDTQALLDSHMIVRHETEEKSFFCTKPKCGKGFTLEVNFLSHMERHKLDKSKPIVCTVCDGRFANQTYLEKHSVLHVTSWMCETCGAQLATRDAFRRHVRLHLGEKPYKCDQCEESFAYLNARKLHILRAHAPESHICHTCGKTFVLKQYLKKHIDTVHEKVKKHDCDECAEKFCTLESLRKHKVREHNAEPIICEECGATFASKTLLKCHKITHSGIKKHECNTCGARFYTSKALKNHEASHSDVRNHICDNCGAAFKTRINLIRHMKNVHGIFGAKSGTGGRSKKSKIGQKVARVSTLSHFGVDLALLS